MHKKLNKMSKIIQMTYPTPSYNLNSILNIYAELLIY